jgi:hypothetical protein
MKNKQARSSAGPERFLDTEEVDGSNPFGPTIIFRFIPFPTLRSLRRCIFNTAVPNERRIGQVLAGRACYL